MSQSVKDDRGSAAATANRVDTEPKKHVSHQVWTSRKAAVLFAPTVLLSAIFVYAFIGVTVYISVSNWRIGTSPDLSLQDPLGGTYSTLLQDYRPQSSLRNIVIFTVLFLLITMLGGLVAALLIHHVTVLKPFFRSVFLLPYALSFIVTGVVWRWIFAPQTGVNVILTHMGVDNPPGWTTDPRILGSLAGDGIGPVVIQLGIPVALIPVIIAAAWQLMGYAMAMYLAALSSIPEDEIEAANVDGANTWQRLRHVVIPQLWPATITTLVLLLHVALKIFDLVVAMSGKGPGFVTDVPGIYIYDYLGSRYDQASAMAIVLLAMTLVVVVPYLARFYRREKQG